MLSDKEGMPVLSNTIKENRERIHMTQQQLADLADVRRETISRLEKNAYNPSLELAMRIAEVLDMKIDDLFFREL